MSFFSRKFVTSVCFSPDAHALRGRFHGHLPFARDCGVVIEVIVVVIVAVVMLVMMLLPML